LKVGLTAGLAGDALDGVPLCFLRKSSNDDEALLFHGVFDGAHIRRYAPSRDTARSKVDVTHLLKLIPSRLGTSALGARALSPSRAWFNAAIDSLCARPQPQTKRCFIRDPI
jgi:hypothetical protein